MCRFMLIFDILKHGSSTMNFNGFDNIARINKCDISKSKLALSTCNGVYFSSTAVIVFTLYEIKQVKIFLGHPVDFVLTQVQPHFLPCTLIMLFYFLCVFPLNIFQLSWCSKSFEEIS